MPAAPETDRSADVRNEGGKGEGAPESINLLDLASDARPTSPAPERDSEKPSSMPRLDIVDESKDQHKEREQREFERLITERARQAANPETNQTDLNTLAADRHADVRSAVAGNPNTSTETLANLANDTSWKVRSDVATNPNTTPEILEQLLNDPDWRVRERVARHPNTTPEQLDRLANDPDWHVRSQVASNESTQAQTLERLASDPERLVRGAVGANPNTERPVLERLANERDIFINIQLASNPNVVNMAGDTNATPQILAAIAFFHTNPEIRMQLAGNPNTSIRELTNLALLQDPAFRRAVMNNPAVDRALADPQSAIENDLASYGNMTEQESASMRERLHSQLEYLRALKAMRQAG